MIQTRERIPVLKSPTSSPDAPVRGARLWFTGSSTVTRVLAPLLLNPDAIAERVEQPSIPTRQMAPFLFSTAAMAIYAENDPDIIRDTVFAHPQMTTGMRKGNEKMRFKPHQNIEVDFVNEEGEVVEPEDENAMRSLGQGVIYRFHLMPQQASRTGRLMLREGLAYPSARLTHLRHRNKTVGVAVGTEELPEGIHTPADVTRQAAMMSLILKNEVEIRDRYIQGLAAITTATLPEDYPHAPTLSNISGDGEYYN